MRSKRKREIYVEAHTLKVHPVAQRQLNPTHLKRIMEKLDLDAIGQLEVVDYEIDGQPGPWIIDGQHRWSALMRHGFGDWKIVCVVHEDATDDARASELFLRLNTRAVVHPFDTFKNELSARDPIATGANEVVLKHGLKVAGYCADGNVACPTALKRIYAQDDGVTLDRSLSIVTTAWGHTSSAVEGKLLEGVSIIVGTFNGELDDPALIKKLAKYPGGGAGVLGDAKGLRRIRKASVVRCVAETIVEAYNSGRRDPNRLPLP